MNAPITPGLDTEAHVHIGRSIPRKEDGRLLTGRARYLDDLKFAGELTAHFVRTTDMFEITSTNSPSTAAAFSAKLR